MLQIELFASDGPAPHRAALPQQIQRGDVEFENAKCAGGGVPRFTDVTDGLAWKYAEHWQMLVSQV